MVNCLLGPNLGVSKYGIGKLETVRHRFNYIQDEMGQFKITYRMKWGSLR